jgi:hypothetical protein
MAQPKSGLVRWMLGRTFYPDNTYTRDLEGNPIRPYDMSTDTFGEFMGVRSDPIGEKVTGDLVTLAAHVPMTGTVAASAPNGYVLDGRLNDSFRAAFLLLDKGIAVRRAGQPSADGSVKSGDFLVAAGDVAAIAQQTGVDSWKPIWPTPTHAGCACDAAALRRRQHGRGLDAADVRAVQRALQVDHGRRDQGRQPRVEVRHDHPAGGFGRGDDRRASAPGPGWPRRRWRRRLRRRCRHDAGRVLRFGADGVYRRGAAAGRHARPSQRRRPAISFAPAAKRRPGCRERFGRRDPRCG